MEKTKIIFERNISGSYMKIKAGEQSDFDERMLRRQKIPGLLPMEKCYVDGIGQYWYNISGRQSLDTYCKIVSLREEFLEQMIHSICDELDLLEQHLVNADCLRLTPEQIFISNSTQEIWFTALPGAGDEVAVGFRELMEYLLTRIDHKDSKAVRLAYEIYEKTLDEGYSIAEIRDSVIRSHWAEETEKVSKEEVLNETTGIKENGAKIRQKVCRVKESRVKESRLSCNWIFERMLTIWKDWKGKMKADTILTQSQWEVVYPENCVPEEVHNQLHPTICLSDFREHPEGILLYEGYEHFTNIQLGDKTVQIGQGEDSDVKIAKNTISRFHARIECKDKEYYLEDLNSTNGTFVNDKPLTYKEKRQLKTNDIICFADVKYRFV